MISGNKTMMVGTHVRGGMTPLAWDHSHMVVNAIDQAAFPPVPLGAASFRAGRGEAEPPLGRPVGPGSVKETGVNR